MKLTIAMLSQTQVPSSPEAVNFRDEFTDQNEVRTATSELNIAMQDMEQIEQVIDDAVEASSDLIVEQEAAQQMQQQGQADQAALESIARAIRRMDTRLGFGTVIAVESYSNPYYNMPALESMIDNIKKYIKKIWDGILAALDAMSAMIQKVYTKLFDLSKKVTARAQAVKAKAQSLRGKVAPSDFKVGSHTLATYMRLKNTALKPDVLVKGIDMWTGYTHQLINGVAGEKAVAEYATYPEQAVKIMEDFFTHQNKDKLEAEADALGKKLLKRVFDTFTVKDGKKHASNYLLGDVRYVFDDESLTFSVEKTSDYRELPTERTHEPLSVDDCITLCDKTLTHMKSYEKIDGYLAQIDKLQKSIKELAKKALTGKEPIDFLPNKLITSMISAVMGKIIKAIGTVGAGARKHDMSIDSAVVEWCDLSLRPL